MSFFRSLLGTSGIDKSERITTVINMVTYAAGLVSNPSGVELVLDKLRVITAKMQPGEEPSAAEADTLIDVYLSLEDYLVTKERLRTFTKTELRTRLSPELLQLISAHETKVQAT